MRFFKVPSADIAEKVSKGFFKLMVPENKEGFTTYVFGWLALTNGEVVVYIDELMKCPVFTKTISETTLTNIVTWLDQYLTATQKTQLKNYIRNNAAAGTPIDLIKLIPAALPEVDIAYIKANLNKP